MPFERPTVQEILTRMQSDFRDVLPDFDPFLPRSVLLAMITSQTAAMHELNGRLERASRNHFADTAELEELERIGEIYGIPRNFGSKASGAIVYIGDDNTEIPLGTFHVTANDQRYISTVGGEQIGVTGVAAFTVEAVEVGRRFNLPSGTAMELEEPISGITPGSGQVSILGVGGPLAGGADDEGLEAYRARVLAHIRKLPQGGSLNDFERWAFEAPISSSVQWTRVFVLKPPALSNVIQIYAVDDTLDATGDAINGVTQDYLDTFNYIDGDDRRPLCADLQVDPPVLVTLTPSITLVPNTTIVQDAVRAEVRELLIREGKIGGTLFKSALDEAISRAAGETDHTTTIPAGDTTVAADELLTPGTFIFS